MLKFDEMHNFLDDDKEYFENKVMPLLLEGLD